MLLEKINRDYVQAMKEKDILKAGVLKMLKSSVGYLQIDNREKTLTDEDVIALIKKEIKKHEESIEMYRQGGREDLAQKEEAELLILKSYLPAQMGEEDVKKVVLAIIEKVGASSEKDFGKVMREVMQELKGKAEGSLIKKVVEESLKAK